MNASHVRLCALVVVTLATGACQCGKPSVETEDAGALVECSQDTDCAFGESCVDGKCTRFAVDAGADAGLCTQDSDCPTGRVCLKSSGICVTPENFDGGSEDAGSTPSCTEGDTQPCGTTKVGECDFGVQTCIGGVFGPCIGEVDPTSEACDSLDNDCDGVVDEDYDKLTDINNCGSCGHVCSFPFASPLCVGGDCQMGACDPSHWDLNQDPSDGCEYACTISNGGTEACDGQDNDCDGAVDEDSGPISCGVGACANTVPSCVNGTPQLCTPKPSSPEVCDGLDNDCNGQADDGLAPLTCGTGACANSVVACVNGQPQMCTPKPPSAETCDTIDNDCDGLIDEGCSCVNGATQSCYSGSPGTAGKGVCKAGVQTCSNGAWGACVGEVVDSAEVCDGKDNDCDLQTDEGLGTTSCGVGECANTVQNCVGGVTQTCSPKPSSAEICDGKDNDCDGTADDGLGSTTCGMGACSVTVQNCVNGVAQSCVPALPTTEVCDGKDNDCDNMIDESFPQQGQSCSTGLPGICANGMRSCTMGTLGCQQTVFAAPTDICGNGLDDNCNGVVDDPTVCGGCNQTIDNDSDGSNQCLDCDDQNGTVRPGATEVCNGRDDDCDGQIDEGFDVDNDGYTTCGTKASGGGTDPSLIDCNDNNAFIHPGKVTDCGNSATPATPNGVDDNCNQYVDETCSCSNTDTDGDGVTQCQGDCAPNDPTIFPGNTEVCDGKDNDCNKATVDNCGVSDPCGQKKMGTWQQWPAGTDQCGPDLICVTNLSTGALVCGSFCNQTLGQGLGDSCATGEGCYFNLVDSDNQHLCGKMAVGTGATGSTCTLASQCRSGDCDTGGYCTDKCTHEAGCSANTTCYVERQPAATQGATVLGYYYYSRCKLDSTITGTQAAGQSCSSTSVCKNGTYACLNGTCVEPCCEHSDCGTGKACSINGPKVATGYVTGTPQANVDSIVPSCKATTATKVTGQSCAASSDCKSGICEKTLGICIDVCCNDSSCANGTTCEPVDFKLSTGERSFIRACLYSPAPALIEQK